MQRPQEKINHALVLGGAQGIGKDTLLEPLKPAIGPWNFPQHIARPSCSAGSIPLQSLSSCKSAKRAISETSTVSNSTTTRKTTEPLRQTPSTWTRNSFAATTCSTSWASSSPRTTRMAIYLPPGDRRHFVAWSNLTKESFPPEYWSGLWSWYHAGGFEHVAAYLSELDISGFDPKTPPPKTPAFWNIVHLNSAPEDAELKDAIERIGDPAALILPQLIAAAEGTFAEWLLERRNQPPVAHRLERCGYVQVQGPSSDGRWRIDQKRLTIFAQQTLTTAEQQKAAKQLVAQQVAKGQKT